MSEELKYNEQGLIPAIIQDADTKQVLMLAYMNEESFKKTLETGTTVFYSRSRQKLWQKGETSGNVQKVVSIYKDCDNDTLLINVKQTGVACHTGSYTCFYKNVLTGETEETHPKNPCVLYDEYEIVKSRLENPEEGSYTNYLFTKGLDKILKKVGEECSEVIIAAKNRDSSEVQYEISDLLFHLTVLLVEQGISWKDIFAEIEKRCEKAGNLKVSTHQKRLDT